VKLLRWGVLALALCGPAWGSSYSLERVEQDVYIQADGLVRVVDVRIWRFDGTFREVFLEIEPRRGGQVRFEEASALDDGQPVQYEVQGNRISITAGPPDRSGNLRFNLTARNFNPAAAMAGKICIVEVERVVATGEIAPDDVHLPGIYVHRIVVNPRPEKRIEKRTTRDRKV